MEKYSQHLEKEYQIENISNKKKIIISEGAFKRLFENVYDKDVFINSKKNNKTNKPKQINVKNILGLN